MSSQWTKVAVVGAGTIGLSWAALFAANGIEVRITDPRDDLTDAVRTAMPSLAASIPGADADDLLSRIRPTSDVAEAVADVDLVQENGPEQLEFKQQLFAEIAGRAPENAVLASSSSGIIATEIAAPLPDSAAARLLIAHPFNPPQVVPLVEIVPGERTAESAVEAATEFYRSLGKTPVRLRKEIPGFVANRLQSAILQESIHLVLEGVVRADELDTVMKASLGGRYATVGPFESFHLGGGPGGIRHMMAHLGVGMAERWKDLGHPKLTEDTIAVIADQTEAAYGAGPAAYQQRSELRDRKQNAINTALHEQP
ncbi:3-hydroxyacyl-CoA dehydrogenase NAD-binding domain-containing protein [Saccharopolyspora sp. WRP15-2]|uniref:3-hydroxyacyl-CoA dehydrogenase NAD-binding domain-containing protein n=1 Tax=Saccharopolyspora oryzae TaxID=2997343 RepID=A0ABT4V442_9PSEU|nr:3-hydroxyacyl-CoA dehydrogenase NAD-binding domain-containing protein [Saccharopolyspora oryzae]MDA3628729.1 3-hydroxyacyl-CoA dehydrogenase NAD-binding domain-containing protein [Saccharopolyspora oryzae]